MQHKQLIYINLWLLAVGIAELIVAESREINIVKGLNSSPHLLQPCSSAHHKVVLYNSIQFYSFFITDSMSKIKKKLKTVKERVKERVKQKYDLLKKIQ